MITITRRHARSLRGILRRAALGLARKGPAPPLFFETDGAQLRAYFHYDGLAIEHTIPDRCDSCIRNSLPVFNGALSV